MPRARNIKPSITRNEDLAELDPLTRLVFIHSWMFADFRGIIEFRPRRFKLDVLPYDNMDIEVPIKALSDSGFVRVYTVQGRRYIKIVNFQKHQSPHKHEIEAGSDLPDEDQADESISLQSTDNIGVTEKPELGPDKAGTKPEVAALIPDSGLLIADCSSTPPLLEIHQGKIIAGVMLELGLKTERGIGKKKEWLEAAAIAFENGFTSTEFLECYKLLRAIRGYTIQPSYVTDNLPDLAKLRSKQNGNNQNGGRQDPAPLPNINDINAERSNRPLPATPPSKAIVPRVPGQRQDNPIVIDGSGQAH